MSRHEIHQDGSTLEHCLDGTGVLSGGMGHITGCRGRTFGDCTRLTMGCLGKAPEVGKGMNIGDLGTNKREVKGYRRLVTCNRLAVWDTCLASPYPSFLVISSSFFWVRDSIHYACMCMGSECSYWSQTRGGRARVHGVSTGVRVNA